MTVVAPETTVGVVRARGPCSDTPRLRAELTRTLAATEFRPSQLPRNATLIVRKLGSTGRQRFDPDRTSESAWGDALGDEVSAWYGRASRPSAGALPPEAGAVVFADDAELLACLAVDLAAGRSGARWWWAQLPSRFRGGLADVLAANAPLVPVAIDRLAGWGSAATVVESLRETDAATVLRSVERAYDLPTDDHVLPGPGAGGAVRRSGGGGDPGSRWWEPWLGLDSVPRTSTTAHAALLALSLLLARRPAAVRRPEVLAALRELGPHEPAPRDPGTLPGRTTSQEDRTHPAAPAPGRRSREPGDVAAGPVRAARAETIEGASATAGTAGDDRAEADAATRASRSHEPAGPDPDRSRTPAGPWPDAAADVDDARPAVARHPAEPAGGDSRPDPTTDVSGTDPEVHTAPTRRPAPAPPGPEPLVGDEDLTGSGWDPGAVTSWGGVLYLVNVIEHLDLPARFEAGWRLDAGMGAWGLLEVLARGLVGDRASTVAADPLWRVLAELDGRPRGQLPALPADGDAAEVPGAPGSPADRVQPRVPEPPYRLPPDWWRELGGPGDQGWWAASDEQLWVWSVAPVVLVSCARRDEDPATRATSELAAYRSPDAPPPRRRPVADVPLGNAGPLLDGLDPRTRRWLSLITPYLRARLAVALRGPALDLAALDLAAADPDPVDLDAVLLRRRARIVTSRTHVDVVLELADTSLPVRFAGLDRSPGWCPRFGRVVTYHFEEGGP